MLRHLAAEHLPEAVDAELKQHNAYRREINTIAKDKWESSVVARAKESSSEVQEHAKKTVTLIVASVADACKCLPYKDAD